MLYNTTWYILYNITWHTLYNITWHMLYNMFCSVRTSSLADIQALVFLLIHSQNVNWITRAQINPRREKVQISFYINQFHLWSNSMFLERICFFSSLFCARFFICIFIFFYLTYIFILEMLGKLLQSLWNSHCVVNIAWHATSLTTWRTKRSKIWIFLFILFPIYLCPTSSLIELLEFKYKY